jgi:hypothetical protein
VAAVQNEPEMMAETAFWGTHEGSFKSAEQMLRKCVPTQITDTLIREVTEYTALMWYVLMRDFSVKKK